MPVQVDTTCTHCVVRWENTSKDYAIVDLKRAKTAVTTLKIGITISFEGYNRERRRGEIMFLGTKKDCFNYGFDIVENDSELNTYGWSGPPGLREQADEVVQAIHGGTLSSFQRTASSSSTTSSITLPSKPKQKKLNNKNQNDIDELTTFDDNSMPPPSSTSTRPVPVTVSATNKNVVVGQPSNSNNQISGSNTQTNTITTSTDVSSLLEENESLKEEIKLLREKNFSLQDELVYQRETSISIPGDETCDFLSSIVTMRDRLRNEHGKKAMEIGKKLPCTSAELALAKKTNDAATINNLVKYCFKDIKDVDLKTMSYTNIYEKHPELLKNIYEYVKHVHAPLEISPSRFSGVISLKTRHIRDGEKRKNASTTSKDKQKPKKKSKTCNNKHQDRNQQNFQESNEVLVEDTDSDKENTNGVF